MGLGFQRRPPSAGLRSAGSEADLDSALSQPFTVGGTSGPMEETAPGTEGRVFSRLSWRTETREVGGPWVCSRWHISPQTPSVPL